MSRLYKVLLIKTVENVRFMELEPESENDETEQEGWNGHLPGEDRYCTACPSLLVLDENITKKRLSKRYYLCTPCCGRYKLENKKGKGMSDVFTTRYCYMCSCKLSNKNCHHIRVGKSVKTFICDGCREAVQQKWFEAEHKCYNCTVTLERGNNWYESAYRARTRCCKKCITEKSKQNYKLRKK